MICARCRIMRSTSTIAICFVAGLAAILYLLYPDVTKHVSRNIYLDQSENAVFDLSSRILRLKTGRKFAEAKLGTHLHDSDGFTTCSNYSESYKCASARGQKLILSVKNVGMRDDVTCYRVQWVSDVQHDESATSWPMDCFDFRNGYWYGGPEVYHQRWPMSSQFRMQPYISNDVVEQAELYGAFVERYFLNSNGMAIIVDDETPLWISLNENDEGDICLMAKYSDSAFQRRGRNQITMKYDICTGENVKTVHQQVMGSFFDKPSAIPDEKMFKYPVWSTWAQYKTLVNQTLVLQMAKEIAKHGFKHSHIEIDDKWSSAIGDMAFDPVKFPDPEGMFGELRQLGFRSTLWTNPFIETSSESMYKASTFTSLADEEDVLHARKMGSRFIRDVKGDSPALTRWWNGHAAMWDFTNPEAVEWFVERHENMRSLYRIDSFKFDGGEAQFLPQSRHTHIRLDDPSLYAKYYVDNIARFGGMVEVRSGYRTQRHPIFTRMIDKLSNWSFGNGLKAIIPACLLLGIVGYPFILPDMIGGNAYRDEIPDEELYIRWLQVTAFMPAMQFSVLPWQFESDLVMRMATKYGNLHADYITPIILRFAEIATQEHGAPIIRPLWWMSPHDDTALRTEDEFLIGDEVLVAPILAKGARKRDVYLPGNDQWKWRDERDHEIYSGGRWLKNFPVSLEEIPYFRVLKAV